MTNPYVAMAIAGICFATWPLILGRSGLGGTVGSIALSLGWALCLLPKLLYDGLPSLAGMRIGLYAAACVIGAFGLYLFNQALAQSAPQTAPNFLLTMVVTQVATAAVYGIVVAGAITPAKLAGFACAALACWLLS